MHFGQICTGGLGCTITNGDRSMADYFSIYFDKAGAIRVAYNDTTNQHHGASVFEARQIAGPGGYGGTIFTPTPGNPMPDATGDAQSPHYAPVTGAGASLPQYDFTKLTVSQPNASTLRVQMSLKSLAALAPPAGKTSGFWITRFQALSAGDQGENAYRIFYVGARSQNGAPPTYFAGSGTASQSGVPGNGCVTNTPDNCKLVGYPAETTATGSVTGNTLTIDVPVQGGFGANRPIYGTTLYSVTAFSGGRNEVNGDVYLDVDSTRSFDYVLGTAPAQPPTGARHVTGGGSIGLSSSDGGFALNPDESLHGKVNYTDQNAGVALKSTRITSLTFDDATHRAQVKGTGVSGGQQVEFTVVVTDNGNSGDTFSIKLDKGYNRSGTLTQGNVTIH
jgi:hypothetical protein